MDDKMNCACCDEDKSMEDGVYMRQEEDEPEEFVCVDCDNNGRAEKEGWV